MIDGIGVMVEKWVGSQYDYYVERRIWGNVGVSQWEQGGFMRFESKRTRVKIYTGILVAIALLLVVVFTYPGNCSSGNGRGERKVGNGLGERKVLGLFSENFQNNLKTKYPASEWPWVRNASMFLKWSSVESDKQKGLYNWSAADAEINSALSLGVDSILLTISLPCPIWAWNPNTPGGNPGMGPPKNLKDFGDFCRAVATRYKGIVDYYQILQEPGWDTDAPPALSGTVYYAGYCDWSYMGMLREGYQAIKKVDPNAYVASGAMLDEITRTPQAFRTYEILLAGCNQDFSMKVESKNKIVAVLYHRNKYDGGVVKLGSQGGGKSWSFAGVTTREGFEEWLTLQNPGTHRGAHYYNLHVQRRYDPAEGGYAAREEQHHHRREPFGEPRHAVRRGVAPPVRLPPVVELVLQLPQGYMREERVPGPRDRGDRDRMAERRSPELHARGPAAGYRGGRSRRPHRGRLQEDMDIRGPGYRAGYVGGRRLLRPLQLLRKSAPCLERVQEVAVFANVPGLY